MRLTTRGRYAVTALLDLALQTSQQESAVSLSDIAKRQSISISYLEQLFSKLRKRGLVTSIRGAAGERGRRCRFLPGRLCHGSQSGRGGHPVADVPSAGGSGLDDHVDSGDGRRMGAARRRRRRRWRSRSPRRRSTWQRSPTCVRPGLTGPHGGRRRTAGSSTAPS